MIALHNFLLLSPIYRWKTQDQKSKQNEKQPFKTNKFTTAKSQATHKASATQFETARCRCWCWSRDISLIRYLNSYLEAYRKSTSAHC